MHTDVRKNLGLVLLALVIATPAWAVRVPRSLSERQAEDVEVCQDAICAKMREQILVEAYRCRKLAQFKMRKMQGMPLVASNSCGFFAKQNFRRSKGLCSRAVRAATQRAGLDSNGLKGSAYNLQKKGLLERAGFVNMIWKYNESSAPLGAILIYVGGVGHNFGHIEIRVNPNLYCSDHCSPRPISAHNLATKRRYKLAGVYLPFTSSIQSSLVVSN